MADSGRPNIWARRKARRALVQALYQWHVSQTPVADLHDEFVAGSALDKADADFFEEMLATTVRGATELDSIIANVIDRDLEQLDVVERAVLRLAVAELKERIDVPYKVVIDEYVELAKVFGAQDSHKYINGVLDKLAPDLRTAEAGRG